jgi:nitroreductase
MNKLTFIVASAALALGLGSCCNKCDNKQQNASSASCLELIKNRTSIRQFTNQAVEKEKIDNLLKAGMAAPSAMNKQPWKLVAITNKEKIKQLADSTGKKPVENSTLTIVVCGDMSKTSNTPEDLWWTEDCGAVTENILLAATAQDLGAVWCGTWPDNNRVATTQKLLSLPSEIVPYAIIAIGYPAENPTPKNKYTEDNIIRID